MALTASVEGLAGIGKTELALNVVSRLAHTASFPGGIFWLGAENLDLTPIWGSTMADSFGVAPGPIDERAASVVRRLSRQKAPTLLILDNVESWNSEGRPQPLPEGPHISVLITTRLRKLGGPQFEHVEVGFLEPQASRALLVATAGEETAMMPGFEELLEFLGGHALALELAGAYLSEIPGATPSSYREVLVAGVGDDVELTEFVRYESTVQQSLLATWRQLKPEAQDAWLLATRFAPEVVLLPLSEAVGLVPAHLAALRRFHLVEIERSGAWRMHRLVRQFARFSEEIDSFRIAQASQKFVSGCREFLSPFEYGGDTRPYLTSLVHLEQTVDDANPSLLDKLGSLLHTAGDFLRAQNLHEKVMAMDLEVHGEHHPTVAKRRSNLALVLKDQGDLPGARALLEQALETIRRSLGDEHPDTFRTRRNLDGVLAELNEA